ncbi:hypothetical protein ACM6PT_40255, partial [Klebsiella pneumoniae]
HGHVELFGIELQEQKANTLRLLLFAALALVFALPALAEDWPDTDWPRAQQPAGPALEAFERYAFGRRDDVRRKGIRTDAVVVIRDGRLVYER